MRTILRILSSFSESFEPSRVRPPRYRPLIRHPHHTPSCSSGLLPPRGKSFQGQASAVETWSRRRTGQSEAPCLVLSSRSHRRCSGCWVLRIRKVRTDSQLASVNRRSRALDQRACIGSRFTSSRWRQAPPGSAVCVSASAGWRASTAVGSMSPAMGMDGSLPRPGAPEPGRSNRLSLAHGPSPGNNRAQRRADALLVGRAPAPRGHAAGQRDSAHQSRRLASAVVRSLQRLPGRDTTAAFSSDPPPAQWPAATLGDPAPG